MKNKTTKNAVMNSFNKVIKIGYCNAQYLLSKTAADSYTCGVYGWNADIYDIGGGCAIVTGYRPFGDGVDYDLLKEYERKAEIIANDYKKPYEQQKAEINALLAEFVKAVA